MQSEIDKSTLKCWYERSRNPYWMINPLKMELLSDNPDVFQVYELIGDNLITNMKEIALPQLERSMVSNYYFIAYQNKLLDLIYCERIFYNLALRW